MKTPAAFFLFAALLGVTRADASLTKATDVADFSRPALQLLAVAPSEPSRFGFAEDVALLNVEKELPRFSLFDGVETRRFERTYARNNPLKYVDPDGRAIRPSTEASQAAVDYQNQKRAFDGLVNAQTMRANWANGNYWFEVATAATNAFLSDPTLSMLPTPMALEVPGEASLLKLTSGNFRQNLMRFLGKGAEEVAGKDAHHMLAQAEKFSESFSKAGLNIHDPKFGTFWDSATHRGLSAQFNADWTAYLSKDRTAEEIQKYARVLAVKYDIPW